MLPWVYDDGGRAAANYKGNAQACVSRSLAIVMNRPYKDVYRDLSVLGNSPRYGVLIEEFGFKKYMKSWGYRYVSTPGKYFIAADVPPQGRLAVVIMAPTGHVTAVIDGVEHDVVDTSLCPGAIPREYAEFGRGKRSCKGLKMLGYWISK